jgi:hypothetical protein
MDVGSQLSRALAIREPTAAEIAEARLPARYQAACTAIRECWKLDELKDLADRQAALAAYARLSRDDSLRLLALRIQARAGRRVGELLRQIPRTDEATRFGQEGAHPPVGRTRAAQDAGLSEHQRKTALRVAAVPEAEFEGAVESPTPPTVSALAKLGTSSRSVAMGVVAAAPRSVHDEVQDTLRAFEQFCAGHDAAIVAKAIAPGDVAPLRALLSRLDLWLERFAANLR